MAAVAEPAPNPRPAAVRVRRVAQAAFAVGLIFLLNVV